MKHEQHEDRRSFPKWAVPNQRVAAFTPKDVHHRVYSKQPHAQMSGNPPAFIAPIKSHNGLLPRNVGRSNGGVKVASRGKLIPAHTYSAYLASL